MAKSLFPATYTSERGQRKCTPRRIVLGRYAPRLGGRIECAYMFQAGESTGAPLATARSWESVSGMGGAYCVYHETIIPAGRSSAH